MLLKFEPIALDRQSAYLKRLAQSGWEASDYAFTNLWSWGREYGLEWAWEGPLVWIRETRPQIRYWAPVGSTDSIDWLKTIDTCFTEQPHFIRVPELLMKKWHKAFGNQASITPTKEHWDYLYSVTDLVELKGNRFHKKKNLLNQFKKNYDFTYRDLDQSLIEEARGMQEDWCTWRDCEAEKTLAAENRAVSRVLDEWNALQNLSGGVLRVEKQIVAFTVAERLSSSSLVVHFEKGLGSYKGVYQAINQMFLEAHADFSIVNREQDLGDEGLRKAKHSYHPVDYVKKYQITL